MNALFLRKLQKPDAIRRIFTLRGKWVDSDWIVDHRDSKFFVYFGMEELAGDILFALCRTRYLQGDNIDLITFLIEHVTILDLEDLLDVVCRSHYNEIMRYVLRNFPVFRSASSINNCLYSVYKNGSKEFANITGGHDTPDVPRYIERVEQGVDTVMELFRVADGPIDFSKRTFPRSDYEWINPIKYREALAVLIASGLGKPPRNDFVFLRRLTRENVKFIFERPGKLRAYY